MTTTNTNKLTDTAVKSTKPKDTPYKLSDGGGMYLLVKPNGGKYWQLAYRFNDKQKLDLKMNSQIKHILIFSVVSLAGCYGLPIEKNINNSQVDIQTITPTILKSKIVFIRPYNFFYYGHPITICINDTCPITLPNQSYSSFDVTDGSYRVVAKSGLLGSPTKKYILDIKSSKTKYLLWNTATVGVYSPVAPVVANVFWTEITEEKALELLKNVEYVPHKP